MNDDNEQLNALLDAVCEGVNVPTDEAGEEAKKAQEGAHRLDEMPYDIKPVDGLGIGYLRRDR